MPASPTLVPYELRIGVTGHRNLSNPEQITDAVDRLLSHIQATLESAAEFPRGPAAPKSSSVQKLDSALARCVGIVWRALPLNQKRVAVEHRTPLRWMVISPLAKGADQIVASRILKRTQTVGKPQLQVITPLPLDEYRQDFVNAGDRQEFERLLAFDPQCQVLNPDYRHLVAGLTPEQTFAARNQAYRAAGYRVVDSCEILIAIWNGEQAAGMGGTGDVVRYALEQSRVILWIDSNHPDCPARLLAGGEKIHPSVESQTPTVVEIPLPIRAKELSPNFHQLAAFQRDSAFDPVEYAKCCDRISSDLRLVAEEVQLSLDLISGPIERILPHYARADQLALRYQRLYAFASTWLHVLSALAVSVAVLQILFFPERVGLIFLEIIAMISAVVLLRISTNEDWHGKWLCDRFLAEQIRIRLIASFAGNRRPTNQDFGPALSFYRGPDPWIKSVIEFLVSETDANNFKTEDFIPLKRFLVDGWILKQAEYHRGNAHRKKAALHRAHRFGLVLFLATLAMATLHWWHVGKDDHGEHGGSEGWLSLLIMAAAILMPAWGAAVHAINTLSENEKIAERSRQMAQILNGIALRAEQATTIDELREEIRRVEDVMAAECNDWWVTLGFRNLVLPA
jgi:hypothetical protein